MPGVTISAGYGAGGSVVARTSPSCWACPCWTGRSARMSQHSCTSRFGKPRAVPPAAHCPIASSARLSRWPPG